MDDELVILGSGGGRHHIRTQYRATGGILFKFEGHQAHIDPGPGAIVRINQYGEDPLKTDLFIVTHAHIDHYNDINAIIEASRKSLHDRNNNYYKKGTLLTTRDTLPFISDYHQNMLENVVVFKSGDVFKFDGINVIGTRVNHSQVEGFGVIFKLRDYFIGFSSDTTVFKGFSEQFSGIDILVLNLLRPDSVVCKRHMCTDEAIPYLNRISPTLKALIITHFGSYMDSPFSSTNFIPSQIEKLKKKTLIEHVVSAEDGLKLKISNLLD